MTGKNVLYIHILACGTAVFLAGCTYCFRRAVADPVHTFVTSAGAASAGAVRLERIIIDLDNDGRADMAVAEAPDAAGDMRRWSIYLGERGGYLYAGEIRFAPSAIVVEPVDREVTRVRTLEHRRGGMLLAEYRIAKKKIRRISERLMAGAAAVAADGTGYNLFRENVETCALRDYLRSGNCLWLRKRPPQAADGNRYPEGRDGPVAK